MSRRRSLWQCGAWGVALIVALLFAVENRRLLDNLLLGPFVMGPGELARINDPDLTPRYFVRVSGSKVIDTGIQETMTTTRKRGGAVVDVAIFHHYALLVGDKFLLVFKDGDFDLNPGQPILAEGVLDTIPAEVDTLLFDKPDMQADRMGFYPFRLVMRGVGRLEQTLLYIMIVVFSWFLFQKGIPAWRQLRSPASHPVVARVGTWGDPIALSSEIQQEYRVPRFRRQGLIAGWTFTDHYIIGLSKLFMFDVHRFKDLLWVYKKIDKTSNGGAIHSLVLICDSGKIDMTGTESELDDILHYATQRAPWALIGYSKDREEVYNKQRQDFCRAIEARKQDLKN